MPNRVKEPYDLKPRKLPSGRWKGRVIRYDSETGKRHELTQVFETKAEAKNWAEKEAVTYREDPNRKPPSEETFADLFQRWLEGVAAGRTRDTTTKAYGRYGQPLLRTFGEKPLKSLTPEDFQAVYSTMIKEGKATSTIHHTHVVAHSSLDEAVNWGLIPSNPTDRVKPPRVTSPEVVPPTLEEGQRLLDVAEDTRLKALWWFISLSGCRKGEAIALKWSDVNWENQMVLIRRTAVADGGLRSVHDAKTVKGRRTIALSDYLVDILKEHHARQQAERDLYGAGWNPDDWIFPSERGTLFWPGNVNRHFRLLRERAGLPSTLRPHDLRHAMATAWLVAGVPVKVVSERLGHASVAITLQIYGHVLPNMQAEAAAKMDAVFTETGRNRAADTFQNDRN